MRDGLVVWRRRFTLGLCSLVFALARAIFLDDLDCTGTGMSLGTQEEEEVEVVGAVEEGGVWADVEAWVIEAGAGVGTAEPGVEEVLGL